MKWLIGLLLTTSFTLCAAADETADKQVFAARCAKCHADPAGPTSAGPVHLVPDDFPLPPSTCP